ncbi:MAG: cytochrome c [Pseudomonadota bacterium]|nr:cytochrome c [Pseudomonadota bacterium]
MSVANLRRGWRSSSLLAAAGLVMMVGGAAAWVATAPRPAYATDVRAPFDGAGDVERGRQIFAAADCASCHASPGQTDRLRLGGGMALASPYGTFRPPNISQDPVDGIGAWRTVDLANALLSGVSPALKHYYPTFPYGSYARMQPADVADLMAYLKTLPAVPGRPPKHDLAFPFNIRRFIGLWKVIYLDRTPLENDPSKSADWNRGRYLVESVAHCAECHSSRNFAGGIKPQTRFAGGRDPAGTGFASNITPGGIGSWTVEDIAGLLDHGRTPDQRVVGASMAGVVENAHLLPETDRRAMAVYLKTLPPRETAKP